MCKSTVSFSSPGSPFGVPGFLPTTSRDSPLPSSFSVHLPRTYETKKLSNPWEDSKSRNDGFVSFLWELQGGPRTAVITGVMGPLQMAKNKWLTVLISP